MKEILGDIRKNPEADLALVHKSLRTKGYVVTSDAAPIGINPNFRTKILPTHTSNLVSDIHGCKPFTRKRLDGLVEWRRQEDGTVTIVRDYPEVAIPQRSYHAEPRVYPNRLHVATSPIFRRWMQGAVMLVPPETLGDEGSVRFQIFETGALDDEGKIGNIVEGIHQDDEALVGTYPEYVNGGGAETSLYVERPDSSGARPPCLEDFDQVASFTLRAGDIAISNDVQLWHNISNLTAPDDGSNPLRRSFVYAYNSHATHQWLQGLYPSEAQVLIS